MVRLGSDHLFLLMYNRSSIKQLYKVFFISNVSCPNRIYNENGLHSAVICMGLVSVMRISSSRTHDHVWEDIWWAAGGEFGQWKAALGPKSAPSRTNLSLSLCKHQWRAPVFTNLYLLKHFATINKWPTINLHSQWRNNYFQFNWSAVYHKGKTGKIIKTKKCLLVAIIFL